MTDRNGPTFLSPLRGLAPVAFAWAATGLVLWIVESVRQEYVAHGQLRLLVHSGAETYGALVLPFAIGGALWMALLLLARRAPERRRGPVLAAALIVAAAGGIAFFAFRLNRYSFTGFWKEVRNTRAVPWASLPEVVFANAVLVAGAIAAAFILFRLAGTMTRRGARSSSLLLSPRLAVALFLPAAFALVAGAFEGAPPAGAKNVLLIALDTTRQDHLTLAGYPRETSPELTRLGSEGALFVRTISQAPWTLSSFASLMTGLYPSTHGAYIGTEVRQLSRDYVPYLPKRVLTLAEVFRNRGYATLCEATNAYLRFGLQQGYDRWRVEIRPAGEATDAFLSELDRVTGRPFFAFLHFIDAHTPSRLPAPYERMFPAATGRPPTNEEIWEWRFTDGSGLEGPEFDEFRAHKVAVYDGCIRSMDDQIGRVLAWLDERGLAENTIVAVVTDHGEEFWDHAEEEAAVYRDPRGMYGVGHGHTLFEEQLRLLLVFRGPGVPAGAIYPDAVRAVDLAPTLLALAGIETPAGTEGKPLTPFFAGTERGDRPALAEAVVYGSDRRAIVRDGYKYVWSPDEPDLLFDLRTDPEEKANIIDKEPERSASMRAEIEAWVANHAGSGPEVRDGMDDETLEELKALGYIQE